MSIFLITAVGLSLISDGKLWVSVFKPSASSRALSQHTTLLPKSVSVIPKETKPLPLKTNSNISQRYGFMESNSRQ